MSSGHAKRYSPSASERWMTCPGSVNLCLDLPDSSSAYADEGTAAHHFAEAILRGADPASLLGDAHLGHVFDDTMAEHVAKYIVTVHDIQRAVGGRLMVEAKLPLVPLTGEDARGTADALILSDDEIVVVDLKYGRGVPVSAEHNTQLQIYALAAIREYGIAFDFKRARLVIVQPRLDIVSEWTITIDDLEGFAYEVSAAVGLSEQPDAPLVPSDKGCRFCRAKATCPALTKLVHDEFEYCAEPEKLESTYTLAQAMAKADLIEAWVKAVRAEVERRLLQGAEVPGYKLVEGKRGNRKWADDKEAEALLRAMRLKVEEMYDLKLISPTSAEKLAKTKTIGPRQWPKVQALITQSEGKPSVAPVSDKRPALVMSGIAADFSDVTVNP